MPEPYWSKAESPPTPPAPPAETWPTHDSAGAPAGASPVQPPQSDEPMRQEPDTASAQATSTDTGASGMPSGEQPPTTESDDWASPSAAPADPWQGTPAGDTWAGVPDTQPWQHSAAADFEGRARSDETPGTESWSAQEATSASAADGPGDTPSAPSWTGGEDPRLSAWGGEPAGEADGQFAAAPQTAPVETDTSEAQSEGDGFEMERFPAEVATHDAEGAAPEAPDSLDSAEPADAAASEPTEPAESTDASVEAVATEATESPDDGAPLAGQPDDEVETGTVPVPIGETVLDSTDDETTGFDAGSDTAAPAAESLEGDADQTSQQEDSTPVATTATQAPARHAELGLSDHDVLAMYRQMLLARAVDERMWLLQRAGRIAFVISGQGHEGAQVAIARPLRKGHDWMAPYYRSVASVMTFGMTSEEIIAAHLAKADDPSSGGRQMPGHYGGAAYNIISTSSPVGTQALHATGIAMGAWVRGDDAVAITYFGEGTSNQGEIHEAMNFAGVHKLPVIFVCENNGYAISVPLDKQVGGGSVAIRAEGYGFPGVTVDGTDVLECYEVAREAIDRARRGEGPTLIEARVVRLTSHSSDDDQRRYRDPEEMTTLTERDPIAIFGQELREIGVLTDEFEAQMRAEIKQEINDASRAAEGRPDPDTDAAERWVYAPDGADAADTTEGR